MFLDFINAFRFLTILPLPGRAPGVSRNIGRSVTFFPLAGLFIGALLAGANWGLSFVLPSPVVSGLVIAILVIISGALHLDGFIDSLDGLFIHGNPERRLDAMKDSRIGSFGAAGAFLLLLLKYLSLESIPESNRLLSLLLMPMLGRWCVLWPIALFPHARPGGLGHSFKYGATVTRVTIATLLALAISYILFKLDGIIIMAGLWIITMLAALLINKRLQGLSGDGYGALIESGELVVMLLILVLT